MKNVEDLIFELVQKLRKMGLEDRDIRARLKLWCEENEYKYFGDDRWS